MSRDLLGPWGEREQFVPRATGAAGRIRQLPAADTRAEGDNEPELPRRPDAVEPAADLGTSMMATIL